MRFFNKAIVRLVQNSETNELLEVYKSVGKVNISVDGENVKITLYFEALPDEEVITKFRELVSKYSGGVVSEDNTLFSS